MDITYLGHSCFKLKSSDATVLTDPFDKNVGLAVPRVGADVVTVSHDHFDHNNIKTVTGTARRTNPFIINSPGEYEVGGVSVFGVGCYHDDKQGADRGKNIAFSIMLDGISVVHLGDLGHLLSDSQIAELNGVDILLCPVGGVYTLGPKEVVELSAMIEPSILIPMHYKTEKHDQARFGKLAPVEDFIKEFGGEYKTTDKLSVSRMSMPEEMEVVVLTV